MFEEKWRSQWLGEDVGGHIRSGYPVRAERTVRNVVTDKVVTDVDMFGTRGNSGIVGKSTCALIIRKEREWTRDRKREKCEKETDPERFFDSMCHGIIFSFSGGKGNGLLLDGRPGHKTVEKIKTIPRDTSSIRLIRGPVSVGHSAIAYKTTNSSWYDTPIKIKLKTKI
jgi:hypothetical protein